MLLNIFIIPKSRALNVRQIYVVLRRTQILQRPNETSHPINLQLTKPKCHFTSSSKYQYLWYFCTNIVPIMFYAFCRRLWSKTKVFLTKHNTPVFNSKSGFIMTLHGTYYGHSFRYL